MCSGRRIMATRLSASAMRSYSSQSALRRRVVALKMWRRARRSVSGSLLPECTSSALPSKTRKPDHQSRDGDARPAVARIDRHDAELRHAVATEGRQHALRIVVDELLDLGRQGSRHARSPQGFFISVGRSMTRTAVPLTSESAGSTMMAGLTMRTRSGRTMNAYGRSRAIRTIHDDPHRAVFYPT